jgi:hypothetical protein
MFGEMGTEKNGVFLNEDHEDQQREVRDVDK